MKKQLFYALMLVTILMVCSCSGSSNSTPDPNETHNKQTSTSDRSSTFIGTWVREEGGGIVRIYKDGALTILKDHDEKFVGVPGKNDNELVVTFQGITGSIFLSDEGKRLYLFGRVYNKQEPDL